MSLVKPFHYLYTAVDATVASPVIKTDVNSGKAQPAVGTSGPSTSAVKSPHLYTTIDNTIKHPVAPQHETAPVIEQVEKPHIPVTPTVVMVEDETPKQAVETPKPSAPGKNVSIDVSDTVASSDKS